MYDTLVKRVLFLAGKQPEKLAVAFKKEKLTYQELALRMKIIASRLNRMGIQKGERVLLSAVSKPEMVAAYLGIQYCGAVAVCVDKNTTLENAAFIYDDTDASVFLTNQLKKTEEKQKQYPLKKIYSLDIGGDKEKEVEYAMPAESEIAELLYTAGTTGKPKGVILTYKAVYHILKNTIDGIGIREEERILLPLPLNHSFALRVLRAALFQGGSVILQNGFTFAKEIENNLDMYQCTALAIVPASIETISRQMQEHFPEIMGRFRYIEASAGALSTRQRKRLTNLLPHTIIYNTWGSSETGGAIFLNVSEVVSDPVRVRALGKPLPHVQIKIFDDNGNAIRSDREHPGRMALKGDMQMSGYWNREKLTAETLKDGWLFTGDMVYMDADGYVYMIGRADDIINVGGEKVSPLEIESIACEYLYIKDCACIGIEDPEGILGSVPILFVVPANSQYSEDELRAFLAGRMERYKMPVCYISVSELPKNQMQKLDRKLLKSSWASKRIENLMNPVIQNILTRRSIRKFDDRPIPRNILNMILQAGYYAPSGHNMQTWRFTVVENQEKIMHLKSAALLTAKENHVYSHGFENPTCIILISNDERNPDGCQDASCAAENILLAAHSYGIGTVWINMLMTLRKKEPVKSILDDFGIPDNHRIWCMVAMGYPLTEGILLAKKRNVVYFVG